VTETNRCPMPIRLPKAPVFIGNELNNYGNELNNYHLTCLICWDREEFILPENPGQVGVLAFLEHFIEIHHLTPSEIDGASRSELGAYRYKLPNGRPFMLAVER